ncbi:MAG: DNA-binding protein, partial [Leifsonia sp.]
MFAITADQVGSRNDADLVDDGLALVSRVGGDRLALPPDRTAGDELQVLTPDAGAALGLVLALARDHHWHVGLGVGEVREPLPDATRAAAGTALIRARDAVESAKKRPTRVAVAVDDGREP